LARGRTSTWTNNGGLYVGFEGLGKDGDEDTLNIEAGGIVSNQFDPSYIGYGIDANGTVTVTGTDGVKNRSTWTNSADLSVGHGEASTGTLTIEAGGFVSNSNGYLGFNSDSTGTATVTGTDGMGNPSTWANSADLYVGGTVNDGTLTINPGGAVFVTNTLHLWNTGTVNLFGGTLTAAEATFENSAINFAVGTLHLTQSTFFNPIDAANYGIETLSTGKTLRVDGNTTLGTSLLLNGGTLSTDSIAGFGLIDFQRGTFELTSDNFTVGATGIAGATVNLQSGKHIVVTNTVDVATDGRLELTGGRLSAGTLNNHAVIQGYGQIDGQLNNHTTGKIIVNSGEQILLTGSSNTNDGTINLLGGTVEFTQGLTNSSSGSINGRGVLTVSGGLTHQGKMNLSAGITDVFGNVTLTDDAQIIVTSGAAVTFYHDVDHNGLEIRTSGDSTTTFFGTVTGSGDFTGPGTPYFESIYSPGNSPGEVAIERDVVFAASSTLIMELGGETAGAEYDHLDIGGLLWANGTLDIQLINDFNPTLGDTFDLFDFDSVNGSFTDVLLPTLYGGLSFDTSSLLTTGLIFVVPEPTTAMLVSFLSFIMLRRRRSVDFI